MKLMEHLPWHEYHDEEHVAELQAAIEKELLLLQQARDDLYLQLRPSTSTWGMFVYKHVAGGIQACGSGSYSGDWSKFIRPVSVYCRHQPGWTGHDTIRW